MSFKLLAIRTGEKPKNYKTLSGYKSIEDDPLKVLQPNTLYKFYNDYEFIETEDLKSEFKYETIKYIPTVPENLYYEDRFEGHGQKLPINISAIVGQNGSGKSSLLELMFGAIYNFSLEYQLLKNSNNNFKRLRNISVEVYYLLDDTIFVLKAIPLNAKTKNKSTLLYNYFLDNKEAKEYAYNKELDINIEIKKEFCDTLSQCYFYTIAINYSHFSLNSTILGKWINNLFHKNDGYQTPLVLNPYRDKGDISINKEEYLTKSRFLSNLLTKNRFTEKLVFSEIISGKVATKITFNLNNQKFKFSKNINLLYSSKKDEVLNHLEWLFANFYDADVSKNVMGVLTENYSTFQNEIKYILRKLFNIFSRYDPYNSIKYTQPKLYSVQKDDFTELTFLDFINRNLFFKDLSGDFSHVTFKLRQVLNYIIHYENYKKFINKTISIKEVSDEIYGFLKEGKYSDERQEHLIYHIPPSFFNITIEFGDKTYFSSLSSGEKQLIYSSTTYIYHILNLNSVSADKEIVKYKFVNIVFDEIELYFHPELQKSFINHLVTNLSSIDITDIKGVNILLVTHSPFILSDIPSPNVLKLSEGVQETIPDDEQSFGANIFDLLQNEFFFKNGFIGDFAQKKINDVLEFIASKSEKEIKYTGSLEKEQVKMIIDSVGEPFIKEELTRQYFEVYKDDYESEKKIHELEQQIQQIRNAQNSNK